MSEEIKIITLGDIFKNIETEEKAFKFKDYIKDLQQKVEQLENMRKEAIEELSYMSTDAYVEDYDIREKHYNLLMNKLNKGE